MLNLTPNLLLAIVGVILVLVWVYTFNKRVEGFDGTVPELPNSSALPKDISGSTGGDPTVSKPQAHDIQAMLELMKNYKELRARINPADTNLSEQQKHKMEFMESMAPKMEKEFHDALQNPDAAQFTQPELLDLINTYNMMIHDLRDARKIKMDPVEINHIYGEMQSPTTVANKPGIITLPELIHLKERIDAEVKRLTNLRSSSATVKARTDQLAKLSADLGDMISAIKRNQMKLEEVPITPESAAAFLKSLQNPKKALKPLVKPKGSMPKQIKAGVNPHASKVMGVNGDPNVQSLLEQAKYLKWNVEVKLEYDPKLAAQDRLMSRLEAMEKRLTNLAVSETPIPKEMYQMYLQELQTLQASMLPKHSGYDFKHSGTPIDGLHTTHSRLGPDHNNPYVRNKEHKLSGPEYPSHDAMGSAQGKGHGPNGTFPDGEISPDVYIRPGFVMTDDTIARRASSSAFDPAAVGGLDYKKRVQEMCKQIRSGQLGDPTSFGCIENPDAVSNSYSWKGNYQMVCNRLGDTWGSWYPEMFGCPKYDPTSKFKGTML